ncbi:MAG TPA: DinB family protein [Armatimonadota bacterium]|jgi:uncharacterized damage-inducible protein DinB
MNPEMKEYLAKRSASAFKRLWAATEGVTEEQARVTLRPNWVRQLWGVGLDGSLAGVLLHVAAWKAVVLEGVLTGRFPSEEAVKPTEPGWEGLRQWLRCSHEQLLQWMDARTPEQLDQPITWTDFQGPAATLFTHLLEHDRYHTGQLQLLRQYLGLPGTEVD